LTLQTLFLFITRVVVTPVEDY